MGKTAREQMAELESNYKSKKKDLNTKVKAEEAKELSGLFDTTLGNAVEALRESIASGLGVYHRNLKAVVVRVSVDGKGVTTLKNTIRTIRMTPTESKTWDESHLELSRSEIHDQMQEALDADLESLAEYDTETLRLEAEESQEPETQEQEAQEPVEAVA